MWRKISSLIFTILIIGTLFSCSNKNRSDGMIKKADLTNKEEQIIRTFPVDKYFAYDIDLKNSNINLVEYWIDYYEKGKFKNRIFGGENSVDKDKKDFNMILFATQKILAKETDEIWSCAYFSSNGGGSGSSVVTKPKATKASIWASCETNEIKVDKLINLAVIVEGDQVTTGISNKVFTDNKSALEELLKNDNVYILRCKFIKK